MAAPVLSLRNLRVRFGDRIVVDGVSTCSCLQFAVDCEGRTVTTIEGVSREPLGAKLEQAFVDCGAVQCGFCTPGMVVQARHFLEAHPNATRDEIKDEVWAQLKAALEQNMLSIAEAKLVRAAVAARRAVIAVDDFEKI